MHYTEDYYDNEEFYAKVRPQLAAGQDTGRDTWCATDWMVARLIRQGYLQKLDNAEHPQRRAKLAAVAAQCRVRPGPPLLAAVAERVHRHRLQPEGDQG